MKLYEFCFSPTGGSLKVSEILSRAWDCEKVFVDLTRQEGSYPVPGKEDVCIVTAPSYSGRVPAPEAERLQKLSGNGAAAELEDFGRQIRCVLEEGREAESVQVPGNHPYRETHASALKPAANKSCVRCGACAAQCPAGAICKEDPTQTDTERCFACMRCIKICPHHARTLDAGVLAALTQRLEKACAGRKENELFL